MTCIVGIANGKNVWIGGDTAISDKTSVQQYGQSKVFIKETDAKHGDLPEKIIIGGCGSPRLLQLLEHAFTVPHIGKTQSIIAWLSVDFMDAIRQLLKDKGFIVSTTPENFGNSSFLIGIRGELFQIYDDYQACSNHIQEDAAGSGYAYAMGSLHTTKKLAMSPIERITAALEAAEINPFVSHPFNILSI